MLFIESETYREIRAVTTSIRNSRDASERDVHPDHFAGVQSYVANSRNLNRRLINGHPLNPNDITTNDSIHATAAPIGRHEVLYSGTAHDFGDMARQSKDGIIHSPAHISATHDMGVASFFCNRAAKSTGIGEYHMLRLRLKPEDKVSRVSGILGDTHGEHETVIPSGTKFKHHGSKSYKSSDGKALHVHHFTIHSQE